MARAKSERARSKTLAIDDLTQSIEQLQAFIPKLEDLGREGFPYLEGALTRTELQLRECIKRAFGEKSTEFQTHRHVKLSISSAAEKKQTLAFIRNLITSLEEKKLELQGLKPAAPHKPEASSTTSPITLVPSAVTTSNVSVTTTSTISRPAGATLHLVSSVEKAPPAAAPPASANTSTPPAVEPPSRPMAPASASTPVQAVPPRTPIEPISSLFRTQETKPLPPVTERTPAAVASSPLEETTAILSPAPTAPVESPPAPLSAAAASDPAPVASQAAQGTFSKTQEISAPSSGGIAPAPAPASLSPAVLNPTAADETDYVAIAKRLCERFHAVARQLRLRGEYRQTLNVEDEHDVQDLLHALLRQHFDDIGTDEWTPAYTDGATRTTFLLDHDRLAIIVKKTRTGLSRKDLADQVRIDVERYRARGRCTQMLCFVYDPEGRVGNPRGLESELTTISDHFTVDVIVAPK